MKKLIDFIPTLIISTVPSCYARISYWIIHFLLNNTDMCAHPHIMYTCTHSVHICTHTCKHKSNTHRHAHTMYTYEPHMQTDIIYTHTDTLTGRTTFKRHFSPVGSGWGSDSGHWAFASIE